MKNTKVWQAIVLCCMLSFTGIYCTNNNGTTTAEKNVQTSTSSNAARGSAGVISDFTTASNAVTPAVVHIKTRFNSSGAASPFEELYGIPSSNVPASGSGSGVIITKDGYIATNNHVVENASAIEVILPDRRALTARLIGQDPNTDLALLKIDGRNLPVVSFGNSDNVQVGEWVLAVGYPLSLNTTVTAGIISAKGRSIGIINRPSTNRFQGGASQAGNTAIESFLQTDAAINPGNSGGALVNTNGELIGINTAIASQTGSYAGYAFAIPVNLAKKVLDDLKQFGTVKRGVLGVSFPSPAAEVQFLKQQGIDPSTIKGVYITGIASGSAAAGAGLREGDIIQSIDGVPLNSSSEFSERIARHRPGDVVKLTYLRNGKTNTVNIRLKEESKAIASGTLKGIYERLGATFAPISPAMKERFELNSGVLVREVRSGGFFDQLGIQNGTVIVMINGRPMNTAEDVGRALLSTQNGIIQMLGVAPDGSRIAFNFSLGT
jgi:Do/DeqQ family serine protease